ncbi:MAG: hypothetical protein IPK39_01585 [Sulfuritalea sp.]|nr:hypothetical protein [Sulfuritalea sp.]
MRSIDVPALSFSGLLAGVDAVITKPGYGTLSRQRAGASRSCIWSATTAGDAPFLLAAWLALHAGAQVLTRVPNWRAGISSICCKGRRHRHLPCPGQGC